MVEVGLAGVTEPDAGLMIIVRRTKESEIDRAVRTPAMRLHEG